MKINLIGNTIRIKSSMKLEDIKLVEKVSRDALALFDEDGCEDFRVSVACCGEGVINKFGISFAPNASSEGYAVATQTLCGCETVEDAKNFIADNYGAVLAELKIIESGFGELVDKVKSDRRAVIDCIEVVD